MMETGNFRHFTFDPETLLPSSESIQKISGYHSSVMPDYFKDLISVALKKATSLCTPCAGYSIYPVKAANKESNTCFIIENTTFYCGKIIASRLWSAAYSCVFVCTIGPDFSAYIRELSKEGDMVLSYIADIVASETAEAAAEELQRKAVEEAAHFDMGISERFSPGYCGWNVCEQKALFPLLPAGACGVQLTESSMMIPEKSVSGVFGMGHGLKREAYRCSTCTRSHCPVRRVRTEKIRNT